jgi:hypothetical protein
MPSSGAYIGVEKVSEVPSAIGEFWTSFFGEDPTPDARGTP